MLTITREKKAINKKEIERLQTKAAILDDLVEFMENKGVGRLMQLTEKEPNIPLKKAKEKIKKIQKNIIHSKGLNDNEIKMAVKAGLINQDQAYWWHEVWQKNEREAERNIKEGNFKKFNNIDDLIKDLNS